jgi:hypothetical protein
LQTRPDLRRNPELHRPRISLARSDCNG